MPKKTYHFKIMQLKKDESLYRDFLFMKYSRAERAGGVKLENYNEVYSGSMEFSADWSLYQVLEHLYMVFNIEHPSDYHARSLSVSDIVSLVVDKEVSDKKPELEHYYVDGVGFKKLEVSA